MRLQHIVMMCVLTFFWIWSLPLLCIACVFAFPTALVLLAASLALSLGMQMYYHEQILARHPIRRWISKIPWHQWFPCNRLKFDGPAVIGVHPHGLLCCGAVVGIHLVPESNTILCVAPILFYVPVIGWLLRVIGCIPARKPDMRLALKSGHALLVVPGGVPEIVLAETGDDRRRFPRHGFLNLRTGVPVVAVFVRGECKTYRMFRGPFLKQRVWLSWRFNVPLVMPILWGWYGTWLPRRVPLYLTCKKVADPKSYDDTLLSLMEKS
jgi:hypothetical protein